MKTPAARVIEYIRSVKAERGCTLEDAARAAWHARPGLCHEVMEIIGNWPSSEPELAALQRTQR